MVALFCCKSTDTLSISIVSMKIISKTWVVAFPFHLNFLASSQTVLVWWDLGVDVVGRVSSLSLSLSSLSESTARIFSRGSNRSSQPRCSNMGKEHNYKRVFPDLIKPSVWRSELARNLGISFCTRAAWVRVPVPSIDEQKKNMTSSSKILNKIRRRGFWTIFQFSVNSKKSDQPKFRCADVLELELVEGGKKTGWGWNGILKIVIKLS